MVISHIRFVSSRYLPLLYCFINKDIYWLRLYLEGCIKHLMLNPTVTDSDDLEQKQQFSRTEQQKKKQIMLPIVIVIVI